MIRQSAAIFIGAGCTQLHAVLPTLRLPGSETVRRWKIHLDLIHSLWMRERLAKHDCYNSFLVDGSPIGGFDFLVARMEEFSFPGGLSYAGQCALDLSSCFRDRIMPVTIMGHAAGSLTQMLANLVHIFRMEAGEAFLEKYRSSVRGARRSVRSPLANPAPPHANPLPYSTPLAASHPQPKPQP